MSEEIIYFDIQRQEIPLTREMIWNEWKEDLPNLFLTRWLAYSLTKQTVTGNHWLPRHSKMIIGPSSSIYTSNIITKPWDCSGYILIARVSFHCSPLIFLIARLLAILVLLGLEKITKKKREREIGLRCFTVLFFFLIFFYLVLLDLFIVVTNIISEFIKH
jgi:hypothetical protein